VDISQPWAVWVTLFVGVRDQPDDPDARFELEIALR
jgi:hypothetical protein